MAYALFQELGGAGAVRGHRAGAETFTVSPGESDRLTALERSVVAIARRDGLASLRQPSRWTHAMRTLLKQPNPRLADPRLEALRRIAVLSWRHGYSVPSHEVTAFMAAGFTSAQYEAVVDSIGAARARRPEASVRPAQSTLAAVPVLTGS